MTKAIVELAHVDRGMYAARLEDSDQYAVFEIFDACVPDLGDLLEHGAFGAVGNQLYMDISKGSAIEVVAKGLYGLGGAKRACLL